MVSYFFRHKVVYLRKCLIRCKSVLVDSTSIGKLGVFVKFKDKFSRNLFRVERLWLGRYFPMYNVVSRNKSLSPMITASIDKLKYLLVSLGKDYSDFVSIIKEEPSSFVSFVVPVIQVLDEMIAQIDILLDLISKLKKPRFSKEEKVVVRPVKDRSGKVYDLQFLKHKEFDRGDNNYSLELAGKIVLSGVDKVSKWVKSKLAELDKVPEGAFTLSRIAGGQLSAYDGVNVGKVTLSRIVFYLSRKDDVVFIHFCEWITQKSHNHAVEAAKKNKGADFRYNLIIARKIGRDDYKFGPWKQVSGLEGFS